MTPAEQAARMDAYYYGFARTGVEAIDRILSAVACAGKAFHHTEDWNNRVWDGTPEDKHPAPYEPFLRGWTPVEWIQNAAIDAAAALEQARREEREECIEAVRAAGRQVHETPRGPMTSIDVSALFYIDAIRARAHEGEG